MTQTEWKNIFGDNLAVLIQEKGLTQTQLAKDTGLSASRISDYINKKAVPTIFAAINIAYTLDMDINELIDFDERIY